MSDRLVGNAQGGGVLSPLPPVSQAMLQIKALDDSASLKFSEYTGGWYVTARIERGGDGLLVGISEHRSLPEDAVFAFLHALKSIPVGKYLVVGAYTEQRRQFTWTGFTFKEMPNG